MNDAVKNILNNNLWTIATCSDESNAVPVAFKMVTDDGVCWSVMSSWIQP